MYREGRCVTKKEKEKKEKAIIEELRLLEKIRKEHEWVAVGQKDAEEEEEAEVRLESETSDLTTDSSKEG